MILFLDPSPSFQALQARRLRKRMATELLRSPARVLDEGLAVDVLHTRGFPRAQVAEIAPSAFALYGRAIRRVLA